MNQSTLWLLFLCLLSSCGVSEQLVLPPSNKIFEAEVLTIILKVIQDEGDTLPKIEVYQKITTKGFLKKNTFVNEPQKEGCIIAVFQDFDEKVVETMVLSNPLEKNYEFIDDEGNFQRKNVVLKEDYLSLRIQKKPNIAFLSIFILKDEEQLLLKSITF